MFITEALQKNVVCYNPQVSRMAYFFYKPSEFTTMDNNTVDPQATPMPEGEEVKKPEEGGEMPAPEATPAEGEAQA